jgi:hypothetical protein
MRNRIGAAAVVVAALVALTVPGTASAETHRAGLAKFCAKVHASLPRHAHAGDAVDIDSGMQNCDSHRARLIFVFRFRGPCGARDHYRQTFNLGPGEGFGSSALYVIPCEGRYRPVVEAYYGPSLLDRKVRWMSVSA